MLRDPHAVGGKNELEQRTLAFAIAVVRFVTAFPETAIARPIARQLLRAGTSIGANYREANRAESRDDFVHKTAIAEKEAAETDYWLEMCRQIPLGDPVVSDALSRESRELLAIFTTINRKAKRR
jgi:four helix bundle protein